MTLIVGIKCSGGIVLAGDGAATLGSMGVMTVQQKTVRKLSILRGKIIFGASGAMGMAQRIRAAIEDGYSANEFKGRAEVAMASMSKKLWTMAQQDWETARLTTQIIGNSGATTVLCSALVALPLNGQPELVQFDQQFSPELLTADLPFVAIGSGQTIADPFLGLVRHVFWEKSLPSLHDGIFSAVWTLRHAIDTSTGGVADPIQVAVLEKKNGDWVARELTDEQLQEHHEAVLDAERALREWRSALSAHPTGEAPESPPA